jgi:transposase
MASERRRHSKELKLDAVRLSHESGKPMGQVAAELGIPRNTLNRWCAEYKVDAKEAFRGNGHRTAEQQRIDELEREVDRLRREREILERVLGIVFQP